MSKTSQAKASGDKPVSVQLSSHVKELWGRNVPYGNTSERVTTDNNGVASVPVEVAAALCQIVCPVDVQGEPDDDGVVHTTPLQVRLFEPKGPTDAEAIAQFNAPPESAAHIDTSAPTQVAPKNESAPESS